MQLTNEQIVQALRECAADIYVPDGAEDSLAWYAKSRMENAADTIERLQSENAAVLARAEKAEAERDAAIADIKHDCTTCAKRSDAVACAERKYCCGCANWQWRGMQKEAPDK